MMFGGGGNGHILEQLALSFYSVGPKDQTLVIRFSHKHLYQWNYFASICSFPWDFLSSRTLDFLRGQREERTVSLLLRAMGALSGSCFERYSVSTWACG